MKIGDRVKGKYSGNHVFSGQIHALRPVTVNTDGAILFDVEFDEPIEIYGKLRHGVVVCTLFDGQPSSYNKYSDSMYQFSSGD